MRLQSLRWCKRIFARTKSRETIRRLDRSLILETLEPRNLLATNFDIHNADFSVPATGQNQIEGWVSQSGCCFSTWDGGQFFGNETTESGPNYVRLGDENSVDLISDSAHAFPIGEFEPNTRYTLTWAVGTRSQSEREGSPPVGPAIDDELRLYYFDDVANGGNGVYEVVASASLADLGYDPENQEIGWRDYSLVFETEQRGAKEPWLGKSIAVGYSRTGLWPVDVSPFQWQSNVDDVRLQLEPSKPAVSLPERAQEVLLNRETGAIKFIGAPAGGAFKQPIELPPQASPTAAAARFVGAYQEFFGVNEDELAVARVDSITGQRSVVRLAQQLSTGNASSIEVWGAEAVVQLDADRRVISVTSTLRSGLNRGQLNTNNLRFSMAEAEAIAINEVTSNHQIDRGSLFIDESKLIVYDAKLVGQPGPPSPRLAQYVRVLSLNPLTSPSPMTNQLVDDVMIVDRRTGNVLLTINRAEFDTIPDMETYASDFPSFPNPNSDPPTCDSTDMVCVSGSPAARSAHIFVQNAHQYFLEKHGRDSFDDLGSTIYSAVIENVEGEPRAAWTFPSSGGLEAAIYLGGTAFAEDVVGHEFVHGVTYHSSGLEYLGQSGAINESLSDVWGEFIDQEYSLGPDHPSGLVDNDSEEVKWLLGEDVVGSSRRARRNMKDPTEFGDPDSLLSYACISNDHGGVHTNSGINNKAAYLMTDGGTHNGINVTGIGREKVSQLYYRVQTVYLTSFADYSQLASLLVYATADLGFDEFERQQVAAAIRAVEMDAVLNCRPELSTIDDQLIDQNSAATEIPFTLEDAETDVGMLDLSVTSSDQALIPDANIVLSGIGQNRTVRLTPSTGKSGRATITLTARDGMGGISNESFGAVVNGSPSISIIEDQQTDEDAATESIPFTVHDPETNANDLIVTASSSNSALLPIENITLAGSGENRTVTIAPASHQFGNGNVTITATDSEGLAASSSFEVTVAPVNDPPRIIAPTELSVLDDAVLSFSTANGSAIAIADVDAETADIGLVLTISSGTLTLGSSDGLTTVGGNGTGGLTISGPTPAINQTLDGLVFTPEPGVVGQVVLSIIADDLGNSGVGDSMVDSHQVDIEVVPFNTSPFILSALADQSTNEDVPLEPIALEIFDFETPGNELQIMATSDNTSLIPNENIVVGGMGENRTLAITPLSEQSGVATITITVVDGDGDSSSTSFLLTVAPVDDAPVTDLPPNQTTLTGVPLVFTTTFENAITTSDVDTTADVVHMQLNVDSGRLILTNTDGLTAFSGNDSRTVVLTGTISALNSSLGGLTYVPESGFVGSVQLTVSTDDLAHNGLSGSTRDSDTMLIEVVHKPSTMTESSDAIPIFFRFSDAVRDFDLNDLSLLLCTNGCVEQLPASATLTTEDDAVWKLDNLPNKSGIYVLTLPDDAGITDSFGTALMDGFAISWTIRPGDVDRNGRFDRLDLVQVLQCGTYNTGAPANWTCGDWDGNGVFDQHDVILALRFVSPDFNAL